MTDPDPDKVRVLFEDMEAISAAQAGLLVPHLVRLLRASERRDPAVYAAAKRWSAIHPPPAHED